MKKIFLLSFLILLAGAGCSLKNFGGLNNPSAVTTSEIQTAITAQPLSTVTVAATSTGNTIFSKFTNIGGTSLLDFSSSTIGAFVPDPSGFYALYPGLNDYGVLTLGTQGIRPGAIKLNSASAFSAGGLVEVMNSVGNIAAQLTSGGDNGELILTSGQFSAEPTTSTLGYDYITLGKTVSKPYTGDLQMTNGNISASGTLSIFNGATIRNGLTVLNSGIGVGLVPSDNNLTVYNNSVEVGGGSASSSLNSAYLKVGYDASNPTGKFYVDSSSGNFSASGTATFAGGSAGKVTCFKADGKTIGYCSSVVDISGACTCN